jgi:hypothetical protein
MENAEQTTLLTYLNQIRAQLGGQTITRYTAKRFLQTRKDVGDVPEGVLKDMSKADQKALLSRIILEFASGHIDYAKDIVANYYIEGRFSIEAAEIAFDIAQAAVKPEAMYDLVTNFLFDEERYTSGILVYVQWLVRKNRLEDAKELMQLARHNLVGLRTREVGARFFQEMMSFSTHQKKRNYKPAMVVAEMFQMETNVTSERAQHEYDYNMYHRRYETAAMLGQFFNLGSVKTKEAALKAFERYIQYFRELLEQGHYEENLSSSTQDPLQRAIYLLQEYFKPSRNTALDEAGKNYHQKVLDIAFFLAKKMTAQQESSIIGLQTRIHFVTTLIYEFRLDVSLQKDQATQTGSMIGWLTEHLEEILRDPEQTKIYHHSVMKLYGLFSPYQDMLRRVGRRMFAYYIQTNNFRTAYKLFETMELRKRDVIAIILEHSNTLLQNSRHQLFKDMVLLFEADLEISKNAKVQDQLLKQFAVDLERRNWEGADILRSVGEINHKVIIQSTGRVIEKLLAKDADTLVLELVARFRLPIRSLRSLLITAYEKRAEHSWHEARKFRKTYGLLPVDIGLWNWITHEFMQVERWFARKKKTSDVPKSGAQSK